MFGFKIFVVNIHLHTVQNTLQYQIPHDLDTSTLTPTEPLYVCVYIQRLKGVNFDDEEEVCTRG